MLSRLDRRREAIDALGAAIAVHPTSAAAFHDRGVERLILGEDAAGLADLDQAIALEPGHALARLNRARFLANHDRFAEALAELDRSLALAPNAPWADDARALRAVVAVRTR